MFITFTYLFSFVVDPVHLGFGHIPGFGFQIHTGCDFHKCFGNLLFGCNLLLQGFIRPVAHVGSGDPVRVLCLYTTNTLDEACNIYC